MTTKAERVRKPHIFGGVQFSVIGNLCVFNTSYIMIRNPQKR